MSRSEAKKPLVAPIVRNLAEIAIIAAWWYFCLSLVLGQYCSERTLSIIIVAGTFAKTAFFGTENLQQLWLAARKNVSHHQFLIWMGINMFQMILSFAFDFHCLYKLDSGSFAGIASNIDPNEALFDCFYLSTLNFSIFGYSDIIPQTVPAKLVNLTEVLIAFVTVIFMLSDFMSLRDSLAKQGQVNEKP